MVEVVKTEKIKGIRAGRKAYSQDIQVSTIPFVRCHQLRSVSTGRLTPTTSVPPGDSIPIGLVLSVDYRQPGGTTLQMRKFHVEISEGQLWKFGIGWGNWDKQLEGYPPSEYMDYFVYKGYGYGGIEVKINKGVSAFISEDEPTSKYYPNFLKHCFFIPMWNMTGKKLQPTFTTTCTGFISRKTLK